MGGNNCMVLGFTFMLLFLLGGGSHASEMSVNAADNQMVASISNGNFTLSSRKLLLSPNSTAHDQKKVEKEDLSDIFGGGDGQGNYDFVGGSPATPADSYNYVGGSPATPADSYNYVGGSPATPADSYNYVGGSPATPADSYNYVGTPPADGGYVDLSPPTDYYSYVGSPPDNGGYVLSPPTDFFGFGGATPGFPTNRIGSGDEEGCSDRDLDIYQDQDKPMPDGIPTWNVHISNTCVGDTDCCITDIHLSCEWFSSARLVDPDLFRRIKYNDCLVNGGNPIRPGESLFFIYANTHSYPMDVASISCNCK